LPRPTTAQANENDADSTVGQAVEQSPESDRPEPAATAGADDSSRPPASREAAIGSPGLRTTMASSGMVSLDQPLSSGIVKLQAPSPGKPAGTAQRGHEQRAAERIAESNT
jgi:hypothetical protein